jgi:serine/threonine protein kinase
MESSRPSHEHEIVLLEERSAGTFARVYLAEARSAEIKRLVAVKVLREQWAETPDILLRTRDEAALLARLRHRSILRVENLAQVDGQPAIIMEFVDGLDLGMLMERYAQPFPRRAVYRIALDTASALDAAYTKVPYGMDAPLRVVHRDIKPSNVMISVDGEVKVLDFGTARFASESRLAETGALRFGSLKYMSPERREGDRGDHNADVYSLGLMLLELLLGKPQPLLPLDHNEHDRHLAARIAQVGSLGLPNGDWEDSLRQTLAAMCTSAPDARLSAAQVGELMRAFLDQATGVSLEAFASDTVEPLTRQVHPQAQPGGLSGSRIFVAVNAADSGPRQATVPSKQTLVPEAPEPPPNYTPVQSLPAPIAVAAAEPPRRQPQRAAAPSAPAPSKPTGRGGTVMIAVAVVAVLGLFGLLAVGGAVGGILYLRTQGSESPAATPPLDSQPPPPANARNVEISATDETIQWVRLIGPDGARLVNAAPQGVGQVAPGAYEIAGKLVARPEQRAPITLADADLTLQCERSDKSRIICTTGSGEAIELAP